MVRDFCGWYGDFLLLLETNAFGFGMETHLCAEDEIYDQLHESMLVGPVMLPATLLSMRIEDIIGVTVLLLTYAYLGLEFIRVGYYVNNDYDDEWLREEPPPKVLIDRVQRNILADDPKVMDIIEDIIGVTVLLLTYAYLGLEFIRVGYYVNNDYDDEWLREEPPPKVLIDRVQRNILADDPKVMDM
ncbi:putative histone chaperone asf1a [Quercus suber]|uniref:Histone chaperone asf1a n=1 Tax=Quercus suber TaxID=58331 RepID=A0AAW0KBB2_QUESU